MTVHLTHEQLCDLLLADPTLTSENESQLALQSDSDIVQDHLRACAVAPPNSPICATPSPTFATPPPPTPGSSSPRPTPSGHPSRLRTAFSRSPFTGPRPLWCLSRPSFRSACVARLQSLRHSTSSSVSTPAAESDEALLTDIDQMVSADVPAPMEPFANPTRYGNHNGHLLHSTEQLTCDLYPSFACLACGSLRTMAIAQQPDASAPPPGPASLSR